MVASIVTITSTRSLDEKNAEDGVLNLELRSKSMELEQVGSRLPVL